MSSLRSLVRTGARALSTQLDRLQETLESLGERLSHAVAQAVSQTVGGAVRETFLTAINSSRIVSDLSERYPPQERILGREPPEPTWHWDREVESYSSPYEETYDEPEPENENPTPSRFSVALATGFHVTAWWLRRWCGRWNLVGAVVVGPVAAGVAFFLGSLADAGLHVVEWANHISMLRKTAQVSAQIIS